MPRMNIVCLAAIMCTAPVLLPPPSITALSVPVGAGCRRPTACDDLCRSWETGSADARSAQLCRPRTILCRPHQEKTSFTNLGIILFPAQALG
ncbi:hypothetical protein C8F04DRAFT_1102236 [Mycena alexandri]|uniref:Secreted protein n=1 Tax=Mycena alexandri TaxID=1745969 RepID=A0AAD6SUI5_9AGAR|nr:hypothetical protein C8F04DRAFT_1102236 [Mycena alexandri]